MEDVARGGRTVIFVSHNMGAVRSLCQTVAWIDGGKLVNKGPANEIVGEYEEQQLRGIDSIAAVVERNPKETSTHSFFINRVEMKNEEGKYSNSFRYGEKIVLAVEFGGELETTTFNLIFHVYNQLGYYIFGGAAMEYHGQYLGKNTRRVWIEIGPLPLTTGSYRINFITRTTGSGFITLDTWESAIGFSLTGCQPFETNWDLTTPRDGSCVVRHSFSEKAIVENKQSGNK